MDLLALPNEVLAVVASCEHLPPGERHSNFSLTHSRFPALADGASKEQKTVFAETFNTKSSGAPAEDEQASCFPNYDRHHLENCLKHRMALSKHFAEWLPTHAPQVTALRLTNFNHAEGFKLLPLGLRELELHGCAANKGQVAAPVWRYGLALPVPQAPSHAHNWGELTSLTKLHIATCAHSTHFMHQVAAATSLQHLTSSPPMHCGCSSNKTPTSNGSVPGAQLLKGLVNITHLELRSQPTSSNPLGFDAYIDNPIQHLGRLVKLRTLIIIPGNFVNLASNSLAAVTRLTRVELTGKKKGDGSYDRTPWLSSLSSTRILRLRYLCIDASKLHGFSQLAQLHLFDVAFNPAHLLSWLGGLAQLEQLKIVQECGLAQGEEPLRQRAWPAASAAYGALTASPQLKEITLTSCRLPPGIWQHAFPAGRELPELWSVCACCRSHSPCRMAVPGIEAGQHALVLSARDLACISAACPNIKQLCVW